MKNNAVLRISLFYLTAIGLSNIFRLQLFGLNEIAEKLPTWVLMLTSPLQAIGVMLGALLSLFLLRKKRKLAYSLWGSSAKWSSIMVIIPIALLAIIGVRNSDGTNIHYFALISSLPTLIYCYFEEIGWRGYLNDELQSLKQWQRTLIIGFLWYVWHLVFITNHSIPGNLIPLIILTLGSWLLGEIIDLTKSIAVVAIFHMMINMMLDNPYLKEALTMSEKLVVTGVTLIAWLIIFFKWRKELLVVVDHKL